MNFVMLNLLGILIGEWIKEVWIRSEEKKNGNLTNGTRMDSMELCKCDFSFESIILG